MTGVRSVRLAIWIALTALYAIVAFADVAENGSASPGKDDLFKWSTAGAIVAGAALFLAITLVISAGRRELLALRRPRISLGAFLAISFLALLATFVASGVVISLGGDPAGEQGIVGSGWQSAKLAAFVANAAALTIVVPFVEELYARGAGFGLFRPLGRMAAIVLPALGWSLMHGLPSGILPLFVFGAGLCYLRERSDSVFPTILLHGFYNGLAIGLSFV